MENLNYENSGTGNHKNRKINVDTIYDAFNPFVHRHVKNNLLEQAFVNDIKQDIWLKVSQKIGSYDPKISLPYTGLKNITENTVSNANRACRTKYSPTLIDIDDTNLADDIKQSEMPNYDAMGLKEAMQKLPNRTRALLEMHYLGGYSQAEIAKKLNKPISTVKDIIQKGQKKLRCLLKDDLVEYNRH
jgi:RNA polymerase sigma-70 factor (ECF subfamily)